MCDYYQNCHSEIAKSWNRIYKEINNAKSWFMNKCMVIVITITVYIVAQDKK